MNQGTVETKEVKAPVHNQPPPASDYHDYHQNITAMLKKGYCKEASLIAEKRITDATAPLDSRLQAAVQLAFATYLKNDSNAKNICHIAAEQLSVAGASEFNPLLTTIKYLGSSRSQTAHVQAQNIAASVELFRLDVGRLPSQAEGLKVLVTAPPALPSWNGPYLPQASALTDPWGQPYLYRVPGKEHEFDVYSLGSDQAEGGTKEATDVSN